MQDVINRLRNKKDDEGFTLIELLVVVVIIGVLVAIAVPVYLNYRKGAADKSAQSDVRGAISAIEQFYTSNSNTYPEDANTEDAADEGKLPLEKIEDSGQDGVITVSDGTTLAYVNNDDDTYLVCAFNEGGTDDKFFLYNSAAGGSVTEESGVPAMETCTA
ncbi:prepilin-type N-terminal cleavage/methylation domain-containing protein [Actinoplanes aureus]|uniref:Prepilin-type N-terminal cleavage/methylation domain-containing protein n=1 Tax=Actinoplanes aureus TaxID=2792083 RepID=A0A931C461_9ACTN|nr:prepilin-type N-terminal cleavage/methylation domain-containing protein [Actinoplanes aureus]MBG0563090.1 prepilin-type N-terminal cleavage/methylation domain-containing protein [Actinoplanes aureus]